MAWIITRDVLAEDLELDTNDTGVWGPSHAVPAVVELLKAGEGVPFRMFDDDDILYYEGLYYGKNPEGSFQPLDNFGMPNAGCTYIQFKNKQGFWETL